MEPWRSGVICGVCKRLVAEGSAWQDDNGDRWDAHWDCHQRAELQRRARNAAPDASVRSMRGRIGAYSRWANTEDRHMATRPAREGFYAKFEREVDPEGKLSPQERAKRAGWARKAHMQRMALKSAHARRRRKG
jgi:hypothetical protein